MWKMKSLGQRFSPLEKKYKEICFTLPFWNHRYDRTWESTKAQYTLVNQALVKKISVMGSQQLTSQFCSLNCRTILSWQARQVLLLLFLFLVRSTLQNRSYSAVTICKESGGASLWCQVLWCEQTQFVLNTIWAQNASVIHNRKMKGTLHAKHKLFTIFTLSKERRKKRILALRTTTDVDQSWRPSCTRIGNQLPSIWIWQIFAESRTIGTLP